MLDFNDITRGMSKQGLDLTENERFVLRGLTLDGSISPAFVRRLVRDYGEASLLAVFLLPQDCRYALDYLLRRSKGSHFRNQYPSLSFV